MVPGGGPVAGVIGQLGAVGGLGVMGSGTPSSGSVGTDTGYGAPIVITDITSAGTKGGAEVQKGLEQAGKDVKDTGGAIDNTLNADTGQVTSEATGITQYFGNLVLSCRAPSRALALSC